MNAADVPAQKRATSYADALRGHKLFAPRTRPAGDPKVEAAPVPTEVPKTNPNTAQKTAQKKTSNAARKKDAKAGPKVAPGTEAESQPRRTAQSQKTSQPASSNPGAREAAKVPAESRFSYAEAVKGKSVLTTLEPEIVEVREETKTDASPSTAPLPATPQPARPPLAEFVQSDPGAQGVTEPENHGVLRREPRSAEDNGVVRHAATWPPLPRILDTDPSDHGPNPHAPLRASPLLMYTSSTTNTGGSRSPGGPRLFINQVRRFSAGDLSVPPVSHAFCAARSTTSTARSTISTVPSQHSALSSNTSSAPLPTDSLVDATIQQAIMAGSMRHKMVVEREERRATFISCHDRNLFS